MYLACRLLVKFFYCGKTRLFDQFRIQLLEHFRINALAVLLLVIAVLGYFVDKEQREHLYAAA